jgi:hypothetical protein
MRRTAVSNAGMPLAAALKNRRSSIIKRWFESLLQTYPESTTKFLSQEKDPFRNPIGHTLQEGLSALFDGLMQPTDVVSLAPVLDGIVRMRAVQDFTAAQAMAFPFLLKRILRAEFAADAVRYSEELAALETRIDEVALVAFDLFVRCREQVYESKMNEVKRRAFVLERVFQKEQSRP